MIWALLAVVVMGAVLGSGGGADALAEIEKFWRKEIKKHLRKDPDAQSKAYEALEAYKRRVDELNEAMAERAVETRAIHSNYGSTVEDYEAVVDRGGKDIQTALDGFVGAALQMRAAMGAEKYEVAHRDIRMDMAKYRKQKLKQAKKAQKKAAREGK